MKKRKHEFPLDNIKRFVFRSALLWTQNMNIKQNMDKEEPDESEYCGSYKVEELLNRPFMNRAEVPLAMDIFKPIMEAGTELPVIVVIHGGGLVVGDRRISRRYSKALASRGYLVFSIEYRLALRANSAEQLDDVCAGLDLVGRELVNYDVDFTRIFLTAESAGAYLATYVAAMKKSEKLQKVIGYEPSKVRFRALGLISGMFYTRKRDLIGGLLSEQFYGDKGTSREFLKYMDPENPEIINNLPPVFFITSRGDFLNNYTLMFHKAMKNSGKKTHLIYYGEEELGHAFVSLSPEKPQSRDAIDRMLEWFEKQAEEDHHKTEEESRQRKTSSKAEKKPAAKKPRTQKTPKEVPKNEKTD